MSKINYDYKKLIELLSFEGGIMKLIESQNDKPVQKHRRLIVMKQVEIRKPVHFQNIS